MRQRKKAFTSETHKALDPTAYSLQPSVFSLLAHMRYIQLPQIYGTPHFLG